VLEGPLKAMNLRVVAPWEPSSEATCHCLHAYCPLLACVLHTFVLSGPLLVPLWPLLESAWQAGEL
jgi:hypothetical protein